LFAEPTGPGYPSGPRPSIIRRRELPGRVINLTDKPRPAFDVYIGRRQWCGKEFFEASLWANPFSVKMLWVGESGILTTLALVAAAVVYSRGRWTILREPPKRERVPLTASPRA
jgi:hypothetical protein